MTLSAMAASTQRRMTRDVDAFYQYCEACHPERQLDVLLANFDLPALEVALDGFYLTLMAKSHRSAGDELRWRTVLGFVKFVIAWSGTKADQGRTSKLFKKLKVLEARYAQLRVHRKRKPVPLRSLPASVVQAIYSIISPDSAINPFRTQKLKWSAFVIFLMFLHLGLRRGEILTLPVDCIKEQIDERNGIKKYWISVRENYYNTNDVRYTTPSIKTVSSVRQIPVVDFVATAIKCYVENFRGKCSHTFLINSQYGTPMSAESVRRMFMRLSEGISEEETLMLENTTGKSVVTPHDLRHTCAVLRLTEMLDRGESTEMAIQKLRIFFGWSPSSTMPIKYARAVFENSLQKTQDEYFDIQANMIRKI